MPVADFLYGYLYFFSNYLFVYIHEPLRTVNIFFIYIKVGLAQYLGFLTSRKISITAVDVCKPVVGIHAVNCVGNGVEHGGKGNSLFLKMFLKLGSSDI